MCRDIVLVQQIVQLHKDIQPLEQLVVGIQTEVAHRILPVGRILVQEGTLLIVIADTGMQVGQDAGT